MSTLKANAVTGATTNSDLTLSGNGTGGVKVNDYFVQTKGSDIASATSLTLGKDGNQFDVTGTTTITSIATQGIGSHVTLHFDGVLTFTHHSTDLILPGAANITTAAGDIAVMYEYASADWLCVSYTKASGAAVVVAAGGGLWQFSTSGAISSVAELKIIDITTDILVELYGIDVSYDGAYLKVQLSINNGSSFLASDYEYVTVMATGNTSFDNSVSTSTTYLNTMNAGIGNASDETGYARIELIDPASSKKSKVLWTTQFDEQSNNNRSTIGGGSHTTAQVQNSIRFYFNSGTFSGNYRVYTKITS